MLHRKLLKRSAYWWARRILTVCSTLNVVAAVGIKLPNRPESSVLYQYLQKSGESHAWWVVIATTAGITISLGVMRFFGSPNGWETLHEVLNEFHTAVFRGDGYEVPDEHKVTIFKAVCTNPSSPWKSRFCEWIQCKCASKRKWLVPVVRSNHTSQDTKTCFAIKDDARECIGVAGQSWARNRVVSVSELPDVSVENPYQKDLKSYETRAFAPIDWIKEKKPKARSLLAIPIVVRGEPWGVLVFDSKNPERIKYEEVQDMFRVVSRALNSLIEKHL